MFEHPYDKLFKERFNFEFRQSKCFILLKWTTVLDAFFLGCFGSSDVFLHRDLKTIDGKPYFTNYVDIVFDLYVLVTTANSPDVM